MRIDNAISSANTIPGILEILDHGTSSQNPSPAKIYISFWGHRQVTVDGYEGSVNLAWIIYRVLNVSRQMNYAFTDEDRRMGERIVKIIDDLYEDSYAQEAAGKLWWVTKIILAISNWVADLNPFLSSRAYIVWFVYNDKDLFELYGREQYIAKFGKEPDEKDSSGGQQNFRTWKAPSDYIAENLQNNLSGQRSLS
jgi:hypothetical protein